MDDDELKLCGEVGKDARTFVRKYMQLRAYADELNARCIADAADAERYRWLRQDEGMADWDAAGVLALYDGPDYSRKSGESLDTAIDAAIDAAMAQSSAAVAMSQRRQVVLAAQALLALDLENDGATCEWPELLRAVADIRAAIAGQEPNAKLTGPSESQESNDEHQ